MALNLRPVDKENFYGCIDLTVMEEQKNFVAPNLYSIAQSKIYPELIPMVVYDDNDMVGFIMFGINNVDNDRGDYWVFRLMIDKNHQGNGYGKKAMLEVIDYLKKNHDCKELYTSFEPENIVADKLYTNLGFIKTGEILSGEIVTKLMIADI